MTKFVVVVLKHVLTCVSDTVAVMAGYADVIVLRHPEPGAVSVSCNREIIFWQRFHKHFR